MNVKRRHYLPRFYLSRFANTSSKLHVFDKTNRSFFVVGFENAGFERNLYKYEDASGGEHDLEPLLSDVDNQGASFVDRLVKTRSLLSLTPREWPEFEWYLIVQILRTPWARDMLKHARGALHTLGEFPRESDVVALREITDAEAERTVWEVIKNRRHPFPTMLKKFRRSLVAPPVGRPFIVGDVPVVAWSPSGEFGFGHAGVQVFFPLGADLGLLFVGPSCNDPLIPNGKVSAGYGQDPGVYKLRNIQIGHLDLHQIRSAERFILSADDRSGDINRAMLRLQDAACGPRPKVSIVDAVNRKLKVQ